MQNKLKHLKLYTILFGVFIITSTCEQDQAVNLIEESNRLTAQAPVSIKTVTLSEVSESFYSLKNKYKLDNHFALKPIGNIQQKASTTTKEPITIYTDVINEITQGDYVSYTMLIKSLDDNPNTFYNLTIENKNNVEALFLTQYKNIDENSRSIATKRIDEVTKPVAAEDFGSESDDDIGGSSGGGASTNYPSDCEGTVIPTTVWVRVPCGCGHDPDSSTHNWITGCSSRPPQHPYWDEVTTYECWDTTSGNPTDTSNPSSNPTSGGTPVDVNNTTANSNIQSLTSPVGVEMGEENCQTSSIAALSNITATLGLTTQQENCLSNNASCDTINNLDDFIEDNQNNQNFAIQAIEAICNGGEVDFVEELILDSDLKDNDCLYSVYTAMGKAPTFANYLSNFDGDMSVAHLKLTSSISLASNTNAETSAPENYLITITFNENNLDRPSLSIARTMIHEMIHAEIFRKLLSVAQHPSIQLNQSQMIQLKNDYPGLYDYYTRWKNNIPVGMNMSSAQHQAMAQHYRNIIKQALMEYDNTQSGDVYDALSWVGLKNTIAWNNLSQTEKDSLNQTLSNFENNTSNCQ